VDGSSLPGGARDRLVGVIELRVEARSFDSKRESFPLKLKSFQSKVESFASKLKSFGWKLKSFAPKLKSFRSKLKSFRSKLKSFALKLKSFGSKGAGSEGRAGIREATVSLKRMMHCKMRLGSTVVNQNCVNKAQILQILCYP